MTAFPALCSLSASSASTSSRPRCVSKACTTGQTVYSLPDLGWTRVAPPSSQFAEVYLLLYSSFLSFETRTQRCRVFFKGFFWGGRFDVSARKEVEKKKR